MGFESKVLEMWNVLTPITKTRGHSIVKVSESPIYPVFKGDPRPSAYVIDLPGHMHQKGTAKTFGEWLTQEHKIIQEIFDRTNCTLVVLLLDCGTPENKTMSRKAKPNFTPKTPPDGWRAYLAEKSHVYDDTRLGALDTERPVDDTALILPGKDRLDKTPGLFEYEGYMSNKSFKALFYEIICNNLLETLSINPNRTVILRGPNRAIKLENGMISSPDENFKIQYKEADQVVGYFATLLTDYNVYVESIDGDVILALLMGCNSRLLPDISFLPASCSANDMFKNKVLVLRNQRNPKNENTVVDINMLYQSMLVRAEWFKQYHKTIDPRTDEPVYKYAARNPVLDNVVLAVLSGCNDYVLPRLLPQIGVKTIFNTYNQYFPAYPNGLTYAHVSGSEYQGCYVDGMALIRFVLCCYKTHFPAIEISINNLPFSLKSIYNALPASAKVNAPTVPRLHMMIGHVSWYMNYFARAAYRVAEHPDPMERVQGSSIWGWKVERSTTDEYGFKQAAWDENTNIEWIDELFQPKDQLGVEGKKPKMKAPRADPTKLISDQIIM
jgi:hypothetical protein